MKHLTSFLPAETVVLLHGKEAAFKEMLKVTFMDLLIKEVLEIKTVTQQMNRHEKIQHYKYVLRGKNFSSYKPCAFEFIYLSPFAQSKSIKILFTRLIEMGAQNARKGDYLAAVKGSPRINKYFKQNFFQSIFGWFSITDEGIALRGKINAEIATLEKEIPEIIKDDKEKAQAVVKLLGGHLFMLNIDFGLLQQIDIEVLAEMSKKHKDSDGGGSGCSGGGCAGCSYWDSGCSGWDSSGCSGHGDSGDSGCGGSGCSGCGGCGGD